MLRRRRQFRAQVHQWKDIFIFVFSLWLAHALWAPVYQVLTTKNIEPFNEYVWLFLILVPGTPLILDYLHFYERSLFTRRRDIILVLAKGCAMITLTLAVSIFLFRKESLARAVIGWFGIISFILMLVSEEITRAIYRSRLGQLQLKRRLLLAGAPEDIAVVRSDLQRQPQEGVEVVGELNLVQEGVEALRQLIHERAPNGVILAARHAYFGEIESAIQACEVEGVEVWLLADFFKPQISQTSLDEFAGRPVMVFRSTPEESWARLLKSWMDVGIAGVALLVLSPLFLLVALAIKITSSGPVLFRQQRCGLNGQPFTMYKFRSMVTDAEQRKDELAKLNEMDGPVFKVTNDPRVTSVGKWLRKFSVDEFPQLYNVVRGEMSLVGPRPLPVDEVKRFDDVAHRRRLSVKPGLTCLWQISGRNNVKNFKEWVRLDLEYIDNWSIWLDLKILFMTIPVVLRGTGAK